LRSRLIEELLLFQFIRPDVSWRRIGWMMCHPKERVTIWSYGTRPKVGRYQHFVIILSPSKTTLYEFKKRQLTTPANYACRSFLTYRYLCKRKTRIEKSCVE
jgi:hypothetical protein